jgi:large subunit ribosomal protein L4
MATKTAKKNTETNLEAVIYNQKGTKAGSIALPESVFGVKFNDDLVHQVVVSMMANKRAGTAHTKDRGEVSGGGKKPWKQKGTGRARHGSSRSPIWTGGGITFGPRNDKDYSKKINKKMRVKALYSVLSQKFNDGKILFIDGISLDAIKTKDAAGVLSNLAKVEGFDKLGSKKRTTALVALPEHNDVLEKSFANLPGVTVVQAQELNALSAMTYQNIVMVNPEMALEQLTAKMK